MGNKSETKRLLYEPFPSPPAERFRSKKVWFGIFSYHEKIHSTVLYIEGFLGGHFLFLENLTTVNSFMRLFD
jgi:hypothetical protein